MLASNSRKEPALKMPSGTSFIHNFLSESLSLLKANILCSTFAVPSSSNKFGNTCTNEDISAVGMISSFSSERTKLKRSSSVKSERAPSTTSDSKPLCTCSNKSLATELVPTSLFSSSSKADAQA